MFDINIEIQHLNKIVNNKKILLFNYYEPCIDFLKSDIKIKYLLYVLELTRYNPEIETYLKQLLENYSIEELNNFSYDRGTVLHYMVLRRLNISLNSFEIIINFGINVNSQNIFQCTALHLMRIAPSKHELNIINLFVECCADLNILSSGNMTVLDQFTCPVGLNKNLKNVIMALIDFGAKTNNPVAKNTEVLEFIESYLSSSIKPAIKKNEIKISLCVPTFFYQITMDINIEIEKLKTIANNKKILSFINYKPKYDMMLFGVKVKYLLYVLELTHNNPEIDTYLEQLLENFTIKELNNSFGNDYTILHFMVHNFVNISLNSFKIIINYGIDVNAQDKFKCVPLHYIHDHYLFGRYRSLDHVLNIIALFSNYGADLNILSYVDMTVLDNVTNCKFNKYLKIIIMSLIDFGARTNNPRSHANLLEFIESYRLSNTKPAIKNEIKI